MRSRLVLSAAPRCQNSVTRDDACAVIDSIAIEYAPRVRGLSIGRKLAYAFGAGLALAVVTAVFGVRTVEQTRRTVEVSVHRIAAASGVSSGVRSIQLAEDRYLTTGDPDDLARVHQYCAATARGSADLRNMMDEAPLRESLRRVDEKASDLCAEIDRQARAMSGEGSSDDPAALQAIVKRRALLAA